MSLHELTSSPLSPLSAFYLSLFSSPLFHLHPFLSPFPPSLLSSFSSYVLYSSHFDGSLVHLLSSLLLSTLPLILCFPPSCTVLASSSSTSFLFSFLSSVPLYSFFILESKSKSDTYTPLNTHICSHLQHMGRLIDMRRDPRMTH